MGEYLPPNTYRGFYVSPRQDHFPNDRRPLTRKERTARRRARQVASRSRRRNRRNAR